MGVKHSAIRTIKAYSAKIFNSDESEIEADYIRDFIDDYRPILVDENQENVNENPLKDCNSDQKIIKNYDGTGDAGSGESSNDSGNRGVKKFLICVAFLVIVFLAFGWACYTIDSRTLWGSIVFAVVLISLFVFVYFHFGSIKNGQNKRIDFLKEYFQRRNINISYEFINGLIDEVKKYEMRKYWFYPFNMVLRRYWNNFFFPAIVCSVISVLVNQIFEEDIATANTSISILCSLCGIILMLSMLFSLLRLLLNDTLKIYINRRKRMYASLIDDLEWIKLELLFDQKDSGLS